MPFWRTIVLLLVLNLVGVFSADDFLLFTDKAGKIFRMDIASHNVSSIPVTKSSNPIAIAYDFTRQTIYWTEIEFREIRSIKLDGTSERTVRTIPGSILDGIAIDSLMQVLFYTDTGNDVIEKLDLKDNTVTSVVSLNLDQPRAITLDTKHRNIYWSDWGASPKIETAAYDGYGRRVIINTGLTWPNAIALDVDGEWLYWADVSPITCKIEKAKLNGSEREVLRQGTGHHYFGLSLYKDKLFFTDWKTRGVLVMPKSGGETIVYDSEIFSRLNDICVHEISDIDECISSPCQNGGVCIDGNNMYTCNCRKGYTGIHCEHDIDECSSNPCQEEAVCTDGINRYTCTCPEGNLGPHCNSKQDDFLLLTDTLGKIYRLDIPNATLSLIPITRIVNPIAIDYDYIEQTIYWTDVKLQEIRSIKLDGKSENTVRSVSDSVLDGIAVDSVARLLFYTDAGHDFIGRINLDDGSVTSVISVGLDQPRAITLDTRHKSIYWTDWGGVPKIETAAYDGHSRRPIISKELTWPNAVALDIDEEWLYWADTSQLMSKIERSKLDGSRRQILQQGVGNHYFGMSLHKDKLFVTDWKTRTVIGMPKVGGPMTFIQSMIFGRLNDISVSENVDPAEATKNELNLRMTEWNRDCSDSACRCLSGFYYNGQACVPLIGIGKPCNYTKECDGTHVECNAEHGLCMCEEGFYLGQLGRCLKASKELCENQCMWKCVRCVTSGHCEECPEDRYGPNCRRRRCRFPENGPVIPLPKAYFDVGETIKPSVSKCPPGLSLSSNKEMKCLEGGIWSVEVVCQK